MRTTICLNGEWNFMPIYGEEANTFELPAALCYEQQSLQVPSSWRSTYVKPSGKLFGDIPEHDYAPYDVYGYPKEWAEANAGVLHRMIELPESIARKEDRVILRFDGIMQKAAVYLDRQCVAMWEDGYLPLHVDVTEWMKIGTKHELHVVCGSFDKVTIPSGQQKITGLSGSWFGSLARGLWQDVYLEIQPAVSLSMGAIRTSVRENRLEAAVKVCAASGVAGDRNLTVKLAVREADQTNAASPVLRAEATVASLQPGADRESIAFRLNWKDARLWTHDDPFLYRLDLELWDSGAIIDRISERFGFREIWTEGPRFMLNGIPINLRGDSWHFQGALQQTRDYVRNWYRMCKEAGVNCVRLHAEPHPSYYMDIADEEGMLIIDETAIYGSSKSMAADHPAFIANCRAHIRRLVERDRNHPSVMMWSLQNEMRWVDGRDGYKKHIPGLMDIVRELDPTRPIILEGDNRLLAKELTEVDSLHYNIDGTISQWTRERPLVFGEHGGWWYVCPQNSSMYVGHAAYRNTDECVKGLAEKERLFVEYARRQGVSGLSTFNFAHYFMRAMPERDIPLDMADWSEPGPKPRLIPKYSLTLNNGMLPKEYPSYRPNPAFSRMAAAFKPVTMIPAEYNRSFFDDETITRHFDVYNDTLYERQVRIEFKLRVNERIVHQETIAFTQKPAEQRIANLTWTPVPVPDLTRVSLHAVLYHDDQPMHELDLLYKLHPARLRSEEFSILVPLSYIGGETDFQVIRSLVPACERIAAEHIGALPLPHLVVVGSRLEAGHELEQELKRFVARGGRVLLLEQLHLSLGKLPLSRQDFFRAHSGHYDHPVLAGLDDEAMMFWHEELREDGPAPIIHAAFEKPVHGDFTMILECGAGDFGDGGDLWSPLLEYRSGQGLFIANQLELMRSFRSVPEACLLLRNLLHYAGNVAISAPALTCALVTPGSEAELFLQKLGLKYELQDQLQHVPFAMYGQVIVDGKLLPVRDDWMLWLQEYAGGGGTVIILPAEPSSEDALSRLFSRTVSICEQETFHLEANYALPETYGMSPVDLFGFDKVFLSPREVVNAPLATYSLSVEGAEQLLTSVEGTAWNDFFVRQHTDEYSRLALVELNRDKARRSGQYAAIASCGEGRILYSQLLLDANSDKLLRLYTRLFTNLGAAFEDRLLDSIKGDESWAVEKIMDLPCPAHVDFEAMKAYYNDPAFSLNNLGEGYYGWMQKKERNRDDGSFLIQPAGDEQWFLSCFVHLLEAEVGTMRAWEDYGDNGDYGDCDASTICGTRSGCLQVDSNCAYEIYINGEKVANPEEHVELKPGLNRFIAIVSGEPGKLDGSMDGAGNRNSSESDHAENSDAWKLRFVFRNTDGTYMKHLQYRLTIDEVDPK
ncbi:glycoside hydrolase family 2 TIM barrel-domain containing protein [Paenibacillus sp. HB172176]|uniref:glycoside hydrolase family 2 protein n=1 Tax=Paenibacillus sp. HB172176 TaxID=2493690 RepID=UPI001439DF67|nr:glycoside hydrolase family 2 TIM barrel-domain containing protein [Paenibacillus sp. HB172176]